MIDTVYAVKGQLRKPEFDARYAPNQSIISVVLSEVPDSSTLTVVFPFWHAPRGFTRILATRLQGSGTSVLMYNFNPLILNKDTQCVMRSFAFITKSIAHDVKALCQSRRFTKVNLLGFSLGVVSLCLLAEELEKFDDATLVVPGNDLAAALWAGQRTRRLRNDIHDSGSGLSELQQTWRNLAPQTHVTAFKKHRVHIVLAKNDRFIPYRFGNQLYDELSKANRKTTCETSPYGHVATIWRYLRSV